MFRRIRKGDCILITDNTQERYLQIGRVIEVKNYPHSDDVQLYRVEFTDKIYDYDYNLEVICRVLMLER